MSEVKDSAGQCQGNAIDLGAYFLQGQRKHVRCDGKPQWLVSVNPPNEKSDGKVRLCNHCNQFDYLYFKREPLQGA